MVDEVFTFAKYDEKVVEEFNEMKKRCKEQINTLNINKMDHKLFKMGSDTFFKWAPMAEEFKQDDEEIMRNSIHFRWIEVRRELRARRGAVRAQHAGRGGTEQRTGRWAARSPVFQKAGRSPSGFLSQ